MKLNYLLPVFTALIFSSAFAADVSPSAGKREQLFGTWSCDVSIVESGIEVKVISEDTYVRNGRFNSFGTLTMLFSKDAPPVEYSIASTGTWEIDKNFLVSTFTDLKVVSLTHPELERLFNIQEMFPTNMAESAEILELTDTVLSARSESNGQRYNCIKKEMKP